MIPWLEPDEPFPPVGQALRRPNGLLAASEEVTAERLLAAYSRGIFPWYSEGEPVLWWSPQPRMILVPREFKVSRSLRKRLRALAQHGAPEQQREQKGASGGTQNGAQSGEQSSEQSGARSDDAYKWIVRCDHAFETVMRACAQPRPDQDRTWISEPIIAAYVQLHQLGHAHSIEAWEGGALVGGLYGVCLGRMFYGESMFARATDASKICLATLVQIMLREEVAVIDCQQSTQHLASLGGREISRLRFCAHVARATSLAPIVWSAYRSVPLNPLLDAYRFSAP